MLVNNAGANFPDGRDEWDPDGFSAALDLNVEGAMRLTMGLHPALAASAMAGGASVVNLVSMTAFRSTTIVPGYAAAKAALLTLTRNLAARWARRGHPGQRGGPRPDRHADDGTDEGVSRAARGRAGPGPRAPHGPARRGGGGRPVPLERVLGASSRAASSPSTAATWPTERGRPDPHRRPGGPVLNDVQRMGLEYGESKATTT